MAFRFRSNFVIFTFRPEKKPVYRTIKCFFIIKNMFYFDIPMSSNGIVNASESRLVSSGETIETVGSEPAKTTLRIL